MGIAYFLTKKSESICHKEQIALVVEKVKELSAYFALVSSKSLFSKERQEQKSELQTMEKIPFYLVLFSILSETFLYSSYCTDYLTI